MIRLFRSLLTVLLVLTVCIHPFTMVSAAAALSPAIVVKSQEYNNGIIKYPVVSGLASKNAQDKINQFMVQEARKFMKAEGEARTAVWDAAVKYNQNGYISFAVTYEIYYEGAAHGLHGVKGYSFETATGRLLRLRDLYDITGSGRQYINNAIKRQVQENQIELFEPFAGISDNPEYYLIPNYVVIVYNPYEIASFAAGILEFSIPAKHH